MSASILAAGPSPSELLSGDAASLPGAVELGRPRLSPGDRPSGHSDRGRRPRQRPSRSLRPNRSRNARCGAWATPPGTRSSRRATAGPFSSAARRQESCLPPSRRQPRTCSVFCLVRNFSTAGREREMTLPSCRSTARPADRERARGSTGRDARTRPGGRSGL